MGDACFRFFFILIFGCTVEYSTSERRDTGDVRLRIYVTGSIVFGTVTVATSGVFRSWRRVWALVVANGKSLYLCRYMYMHNSTNLICMV